MGVITFLLTSLVNILYIVLILLIIFIILILLVLLIPFKYYLTGIKDENIDIYLKISWLLSLLQIEYFNNEDTLYLKIFGKKIKNKTRDKEEKVPKKEEQVKIIESKPKVKDKNTLEFKTEETFEKNKNTIKEKINKYRDIYNGFYDYFKHVNTLKNKKQILILSLDYIKKIYLSLNIKLDELYVEIGFKEKHNTGKALGIIGIVFGILSIDAKVYGNFNKEASNCSVKLTGKVRLLNIIYYTIRYILKKPILSIIKQIRRKEG